MSLLLFFLDLSYADFTVILLSVVGYSKSSLSLLLLFRYFCFNWVCFSPLYSISSSDTEFTDLNSIKNYFDSSSCLSRIIWKVITTYSIFFLLSPSISTSRPNFYFIANSAIFNIVFPIVLTTLPFSSQMYVFTYA